jgi:hypothetical protein
MARSHWRWYNKMVNRRCVFDSTTSETIEVASVLTRSNLWELYRCSPIELPRKYLDILSEKTCRGKQLKGIWPTVREYWFRDGPLFRDQIDLLYDCFDRHGGEDPEHRRHESGRTWLTRFFHLANTHKWHIVDVNRRALPFDCAGWSCRTNYHLEAIEDGNRVIAYLKFGKEWDRPSIITTLAMIRAYDETTPQGGSSIYTVRTDYRLYCMSKYSEFHLGENEYQDWLADTEYKLHWARRLVNEQQRVPALQIMHA